MKDASWIPVAAEIWLLFLLRINGTRTNSLCGKNYPRITKFCLSYPLDPLIYTNKPISWYQKRKRLPLPIIGFPRGKSKNFKFGPLPIERSTLKRVWVQGNMEVKIVFKAKVEVLLPPLWHWTLTLIRQSPMVSSSTKSGLHRLNLVWKQFKDSPISKVSSSPYQLS